MRLIVGVLSCLKYSDRRLACQETWANDTNTEILFLTGDPQTTQPHQDGNTLICPCDDDYHSLSLKTKFFCEWTVNQRNFDYLFKCDDDTYVHLDRLKEYKTAADYIGYTLDENPGYYHASGGAGYLLSNKAARLVAENPIERTFAEDWAVWKLLSSKGINPTRESRFRFDHKEVPAKGNDLISCHWCSPQKMREIHKAV